MCHDEDVLTVKVAAAEGRSFSELILPTKAHDADSGYDLNSVEEVIITPGDVKLVKTGIRLLDLPKGYEAQIRSRSGLALKNSVMVLNSPGTVDAGYTGTIGVILYNAGKKDFHVKIGDRIAQMVFVKLPEVALVSHGVEKHPVVGSSRGANGFGSSGVRETEKVSG